MNEKEKRFRDFLLEKAPRYYVRQWGDTDNYLAHFSATTAEEKRGFNELWKEIDLTDVEEYKELVTTEYDVWGDIWIYPTRIHVRSGTIMRWVHHANALRFSLEKMKALVALDQDSYLRDDVRIDSKEYLSEVLKDYKLCPEDIDKIWAIINKKDSH